jgi:hypothetical protein
VYSNAGYEQPLEIRKGSDLDFTLTLFAGQASEPLDLNGVAEVVAVLRKVGAPDNLILFQCTLATDKLSGVVRLFLDRDITKNLELSPTRLFAPVNYKWTADVRMADDRVLPICFGNVKIIEGETQWP